jgi:hypothetical protein
MLEFDFDQIENVYKAPPAWWSIILDQQNINIEQQVFDENIKDQYLRFEMLPNNFFNEIDIDIIPKKSLLNFIIYIDQNILGIPYLEKVIQDVDKLLLYSRSVYEFLFVDFLKSLIPIQFQLDKTLNREVLVKWNPEKWRNVINDYLNNNLKQLNNVYNINNSLNQEMIKFSILIDLFSNNLDKFYEAFISKLIIKYNDSVYLMH